MTMNFEEKVLQGLLKCGVSAESVSIKTPLGVAVSGGADSVSLLLALSRIFSPDFIKVITVNHGIREKSQTDGDAAFVKDFCKKLGIFCKEKVFEQGQIQKIAEARRKGIEEAARFKRYEAFEDFIKEENLVGLCLAHHQGDVLETVLMRFFNGSGAEGLSGIASRREKYLRPLLEINRQEIESYLVQNNISWCTDSTNLQNDYARNKIRNLLVPFLNENFPQWQEGLVSASEKFQADKLFFEAVVSQKLQKLVKKQTETEIVLDLDKFCSLDFALKQRIVYRMLNSLGFGERFPFKLVKEICSWKNISKAQIKFSKIKIAAKNEKIVFSVLDEAVISEGFSFLFEDLKTEFEHEGIRLFVKKSEEKNLLCVQTEQNCVCCGVKFPFLVRSFQQDDFIKTASGGFKKVSDVFSDWKLDEKQKNKVLVVQLLDSELSLRALFASHFGAQNWIV